MRVKVLNKEMGTDIESPKQNEVFRVINLNPKPQALSVLAGHAAPRVVTKIMTTHTPSVTVAAYDPKPYCRP